MIRITFILLLILTQCSSSDSLNENTDENPTIIDAHMHLVLNQFTSDLSELTTSMADNDISDVLVVSGPDALIIDDENLNDSAEILSFVESQNNSIHVFYGGNELNPMLHAVGRSTELTQENIYPNGGAPANISTSITDMEAVAANPAAAETTFRQMAQDAAESGLYVGFGEISPLHYSLNEGQPDIEFPADHDWMLILSDIAAEHGMPIDIHMEATASSILSLENLLAYNRETTIIWEHAGWTNSGELTVTLLNTLMSNHPNLYISLKMREPESDEMLLGYPLDDMDVIDPDWYLLLTTYSNRIMVGNDVKCWEDESIGVSESITYTQDLMNKLLQQLPDETIVQIQFQTAETLFGI